MSRRTRSVGPTAGAPNRGPIYTPRHDPLPFATCRRRRRHRGLPRSSSRRAPILGHAELDTATPADKSTVPPPTEVVLTFTETLDPSKSSIKLADAGGQIVAQGSTVDTGDTKTMRLVTPNLAAGTYTVRWISASAQDGDLDHGETTFTVTAAASPPPSVAPSAESSVEPRPPSSPSADGRPERRPVPVGAADDARHLDQRRDHPDRRGPGRPRRARALAAPRPGTRSRSRRGMT